MGLGDYEVRTSEHDGGHGASDEDQGDEQAGGGDEHQTGKAAVDNFDVSILNHISLDHISHILRVRDLISEVVLVCDCDCRDPGFIHCRHRRRYVRRGTGRRGVQRYMIVVVIVIVRSGGRHWGQRAKQFRKLLGVYQRREVPWKGSGVVGR